VKAKRKIKRKILIISDNSAVTESIAKNIAEVFGTAGFADLSAAVVSAEDFSATMLLPASAFFLGCEKPEPPGFKGIKELFGHINLAGRPCGVFSSQKSTVKYLSELVRDSEAVLGCPLVVKNGVANGGKLQKWVGDILGGAAWAV